MSLHLVTGFAGKEHITANDQGSFNMGVLGNGNYVLDHGEKFKASIYSNNVIQIASGDLVMQGRHVRLAAETFEEVAIASGRSGKSRNDLICVRYKKVEATGVESVSFVVIQGDEKDKDPVDPTYNEGNITDGQDLIADFPLYRVKVVGTNVLEPIQLFGVLKNEADFRAGALSGENDFILVNKQALAFVENVCEIADERITEDSLADVYFTADCIKAAEKASIEVNTAAGAVIISAGRTPEGTLTATIHIRVV